MTVQRVFNFSSGPAVLPVPVLEQIQRDLIALPGVGMSILEISHRSKPFEAILAEAEADIRTLAGIPANYKVLFLQGGASTQFAMVPMNLMAAGGTADYILTGGWSDKAFEEAKQRSLARMSDITASYAPFAWIPGYAAKMRALFGEDFWPYGLEKNRTTIEAFLKFGFEQGVCHKKLSAEELFAKQVLTSYKV